MNGRAVAFAVMTAGIVLMVFTMTAKPMPRLLWNASASVPIGLYRVEPIRTLAVADLVVAAAPGSLATVFAQRDYLPLGVPLIKRILALPGQSVCRKGLLITVDGKPVGTALAQDSHGRALPVWQRCRRIARDEVFLMNADAAASLDGRYFGPIPITAIVGRAFPLWTSARQ
jgi:conjugative transfer signal peptidase TraF